MPTKAELAFFEVVLTQQRRLEVAFRIKKLDDEEARILAAEWVRALRGWSGDELVAAVDAWIDSNAEFPPRVGQILRLASDRALGAPALDEVLRRIEFARERRIDPEELLDDCSAARVALAAAGDGLRFGSEPGIFVAARKVFAEVFERSLEHERAELVGRRRSAALIPAASTPRALATRS